MNLQVIIVPHRKHPCILPVPPRHRNNLLRLRLFPSRSMSHMASIRLLRASNLGHCTNGQLIHPLLKLHCTQLHHRHLASHHTSSRILPLFGLLHIERKHAKILAVHALLVNVQVRT